MTNNVFDLHGHLYYTTTPDIWDAFAALASMALTTSIFCLMIACYIMVVQRPRSKYWFTHTLIIWASGLYYTYTYFAGIKSVIAIVYNPGGDVNPSSVLRTLAISTLCFTAAGIITRVRYVVKHLRSTTGGL